MANVIPGKGTTLTMGGAAIAQRVSLSGPAQEYGTAETTHLDSAARTYRGTIPDGGTVSGKLYLDAAGTHSALIDAMGTIEEWVLTFPPDTTVEPAVDGPVITFDGILTKCNPTGIEVDSNVEMDFEIKVTGVVVWS